MQFAAALRGPFPESISFADAEILIQWRRLLDVVLESAFAKVSRAEFTPEGTRGKTMEKNTDGKHTMKEKQIMASRNKNAKSRTANAIAHMIDSAASAAEKLVLDLHADEVKVITSALAESFFNSIMRCCKKLNKPNNSAQR